MSLTVNRLQGSLIHIGVALFQPRRAEVGPSITQGALHTSLALKSLLMQQAWLAMANVAI